MKKIGLFYASNTGATEIIADQIEKLIGYELVDSYNIYKSDIKTFDKYNRLVLGISTCEDGKLQDDWTNWFDNLKSIDFSDKKVALFGLSDQYVYDEWFADGMGIIARIILDRGGEVIGEWSTEGYKYSASMAELVPERFVGLPIDENNQPEMTTNRIENWTTQLIKEFSLEDSSWEAPVSAQ